MKQHEFTELSYRQAEYEGLKLQAESIYKGLFKKPLPKGWEVVFGLVGVTVPSSKAVYLFQRSVEQDPVTFVHELVHVAHPDWDHGKRFAKEVRRLTKKLLNSKLIDKERL